MVTARKSQAGAAMAAVLCLVLLPLSMAFCGMLVGVIGTDLTPGTVLAGLAFLILGGGMFFGAFNLARQWDNEQH